jgi:hypothetical protein
MPKPWIFSQKSPFLPTCLDFFTGTTDHADMTDEFLSGIRRGGRPTIGHAIRRTLPIPRDPWSLLLRFEGGDDFFEARIAAKRVPKWQ